MFLTIFLGLCVVLIGYILCRKSKTTEGNKLPGPTPLPILGNLLQIGFQPHITFTKWAKLYGPIYGIKLGLKDAVVVNDYKLIRELLNETESTGRMGDNAVLMEFSKGPHGIINSSGSNWVAQRKFIVQTLHSLGFAKTSMETMILDEVQLMLDFLRNQEGSPLFCHGLFTTPVVNSLWRILSGERCEWEKCTPTIVDKTEEFFKHLMNLSVNGLFYAPFLRFIAPNWFGWNRYVDSVNSMLKLFQESIAKHMETFDSANLRDYIDYNLLEIGKHNDPKSCFYKDTGNANLMAGITDLFLAGTANTATTISWTMLYLSENQNVQKTLQNEINEVVGSTLPALTDRVNMPYSEAVISEVLRISSVAPIGIPHSMISDLVFHGYHIPRGTTVFANLYDVHHEPEIWGDPKCFRPERFLNKDKTKNVRNEALIPFSAGKRKCIGENFAMDTLFLFVTSICQNFTILPDPNYKEKADLEPDFGLLLKSKPFKLVFKSRKCEKI